LAVNVGRVEVIVDGVFVTVVLLTPVVTSTTLVGRGGEVTVSVMVKTLLAVAPAAVTVT
jgi:hypothetical protein